MVRAVASVSTPPLAVPPSSCTWKVKRADRRRGCVAGAVKRSWPAVMSLTGMIWPAVTAAPLASAAGSAASCDLHVRAAHCSAGRSDR